MKHPYIISSIALSMLAFGGVAHAAIVTPESAVASSVAACGRLPLSERGICKQQAVSGQSPNGALAMSAGDRRSMSEMQGREIDADTARYRTRLASCARLPLSERTTCASEAGRMSTSTSASG